MTMLHHPHPDDERLAALAGADPDAVGDDTLAAHLAACQRCSGIVADLRSLRVALADLPDVAPPRALQLVPPVMPEPPSSRGWLGILRRVTPPAMAVAVVLILVGAVGSTGSLLQSAATGAGGVPAAMDGGQRAVAGASAAASAGASTGDTSGEFVAIPTPTAPPHLEPASGPTSDKSGAGAGSNSRLGQTVPAGGWPYPWLLGAGVVLLTAVLLARGALARSVPGDRGP